MQKIEVKEGNKYPVEHVKVTVKKICTLCKSGFNWDDFYRTIGRSLHAEPNNGVCSHCQFWVDNLMYDRKREYAVVNGEHYVVGNQLKDYVLSASDTLESIVKAFKSPGHNHMKGMGGTKYALKINNRIVITDDLWGQGEIPAHMRDYPMFKDNAEILVVA